MSFVIAAPELLETAAHDLAGIGSTLGEVTGFAAAPTTGIAAAGTDEVSVAISALFGEHAQEFQALAARAAAFHDQFVGLMKSGAGAYLSTEAANVEQTLAGAVTAPAQALGAGGGAAGALGQVEGALGSIGQNLGGVTQKLSGAASLLAGRIDSGVQDLPKAFANVPAELKTLGTGAQGLFSQSNIAAIEAPYQALITNTETNLQGLQSAITANPSPLLHQIISNQTGYAQTIATALQNAGKDLGTEVTGLQTSFQAAAKALQAGNFNAAGIDFFQGLENFILPGFSSSGTGPITITPTGVLGDLLPIFAIPGQMAQNMANTIQTLTDFSTTFDTNTFGITFGLPLALTLDALGSPITTLTALGSSADAITSAMHAGNMVGAIDGILDAPAKVANAFLNGQTMVSLPPITLDLFGSSITAPAEIPFGGILAPLSPITIIFDGVPLQLLDGTHIGGIIPALMTFAPEQLAQAIAPITGDM